MKGGCQLGCPVNTTASAEKVENLEGGSGRQWFAVTPAEAGTMATDVDASAASSAAPSAVTLVEPIRPGSLPGMVSDAPKPPQEVTVRVAGPGDSGATQTTQEATAVLPRNGKDKSPGVEGTAAGNGGRGRRKNWFWRTWMEIEQQEVRSSSLPLRAFRRPAQSGTAGCCTVLFAALSGILLSTAGSFEEIIVSYSHMDASKVFTVDEDLEGPVLVWYEIPGLMLNHKYAVQSKDEFLMQGKISAKFSGYQCEDAKTLTEVRWRRRPSPLYLAGGAQNYRPCGLVSLAMFTDTFNIYNKQGAQVVLDETDLALDTDKDIYEETILPIGGQEGYTIDGAVSWLRVSNLERFKVWYRTPASDIVRQLYARIRGGLPAGQYSLNFTVNDPVFEASWSVPEKRIILSLSKKYGNVGACRALGIFCVFAAVLEGSATIIFLAAPLLGAARYTTVAPSLTLLTEGTATAE